MHLYCCLEEPDNLSHIRIAVCKCFQMGQSQILSFDKVLEGLHL